MLKYSCGNEARVGDVVRVEYRRYRVERAGDAGLDVLFLGFSAGVAEVYRDQRAGLFTLVSRAEGHRKDDQAKPDFTLFDPAVLLEVAEVFTHGAGKYGADNWRSCTEPKRYVKAAERHINAWLRGEAEDGDTGKSHLAHAVCSLAMARGIEHG